VGVPIVVSTRPGVAVAVSDAVVDAVVAASPGSASEAVVWSKPLALAARVTVTATLPRVALGAIGVAAVEVHPSTVLPVPDTAQVQPVGVGAALGKLSPAGRFAESVGSS
jgi:hypothetical protein